MGAGVVTSLDLQDAKFTNIADLTLSKTYLVSASTTTVLIPTDPSITELPPDFLNLSSAMKEICIPRNIEKIGARAFLNQYNLNHVTTTDAEGRLSTLAMVKGGENVYCNWRDVMDGSCG